MRHSSWAVRRRPAHAPWAQCIIFTREERDTAMPCREGVGSMAHEHDTYAPWMRHRAAPVRILATTPRLIRTHASDTNHVHVLCRAEELAGHPVLGCAAPREIGVMTAAGMLARARCRLSRSVLSHRSLSFGFRTRHVMLGSADGACRVAWPAPCAWACAARTAVGWCGHIAIFC